MNRDVIVSINGSDRTIKKMPLGKYAEVLLALQELPKHLEGIDSFSTEEIIQRLPNMVATTLPELAKIISIATEIPEKEIIENMGLDELTDVVIAILDVNDIEKVVDNIKKVMARKVFQGVKVPKQPAPPKNLTD